MIHFQLWDGVIFLLIWLREECFKMLIFLKMLGIVQKKVQLWPKSKTSILLGSPEKWTWINTFIDWNCFMWEEYVYIVWRKMCLLSCVPTRPKHDKSDHEWNMFCSKKCSHQIMDCANHDRNMILLIVIETTSRGSFN